MGLVLNGMVIPKVLIPSSGDAGKFLETDGSTLLWNTPGAVVGVTGPASPVTGHMWLDKT